MVCWSDQYLHPQPASVKRCKPQRQARGLRFCAGLAAVCRDELTVAVIERPKIDLAPPAESKEIALAKYANSREPHLHSTYTTEDSTSNRDVSWRGGRDSKVRPPAGQAWTAQASAGQTPKNRGLAEAAGGPERPGVDSNVRA